MSNKFIFETEARATIHRDGIDSLLDWLSSTDFYDCPASTRYHGANEGGLVEHSLSVYKWTFEVADFVTNHGHVGLEPLLPVESLAIVSLFHDICKVNTYIVDYKNQKNDTTGKWERVPYYRADDTTGFGAHGAKSIFLINNHMKLTRDETVAILHHMGAWDKSTYSDPGKAYDSCPLAWVLHAADEAATYISKT